MSNESWINKKHEFKKHQRIIRINNPGEFYFLARLPNDDIVWYKKLTSGRYTHGITSDLYASPYKPEPVFRSFWQWYKIVRGRLSTTLTYFDVNGMKTDGTYEEKPQIDTFIGKVEESEIIKDENNDRFYRKMHSGQLKLIELWEGQLDASRKD